MLTAVTFRVVPAFLLTAREEPMGWAEVIARLDELASANEHFEFYWFPHTDGCLTKRNNRSDGPARPLPRWRHQLDDEFLSNTLFGATCRLGQRYPAVIPAINGIAGKALGARTYTDAAYRVFTSPRRVRFKEQEYAIPREHLAEALTAIREPVLPARLADQLPDRGPDRPRRRCLAVHRLRPEHRLHRHPRLPHRAAPGVLPARWRRS